MSAVGRPPPPPARPRPPKRKLRVTQIRSGVKRPPTQQQTLRGLGLSGPHSTVVVANTPAFRGAIKKVIHLVTVEETDG